MKKATALPERRAALLILLAFLCIPSLLFAQVKYRSASSSITVSGTSTLHDWKETSAKGTVNAVFTTSQNKLTGLSILVFTMPATSLKSEHKTMDNNTYKALKADKHPDITYVLSSATMTPVNANTFSVKTRGKLTIAGTTRETEVDGTARLNADNSISVSGSKRLRMTDFNVTPPKVMMIKAGNDLTISYSLKLVR